MKKVLAVIVMAVFLLTACGGAGGGAGGGGSDEPVSVDSLKTIGDVIALEAEDLQYAVYNNHVIYAFKLGDSYYRAIAAISDEDQQAYFDIDFDEEDYQEKQNKIVENLPIDKMENLSDQILSQDELDALVGKTGQELQDEGWTYSGHNLEDMQFWMNYGPFLYTVTFDGKVAEADYDSFEDEAGTRDMTVTAAEYMAFGDATNIDE